MSFQVGIGCLGETVFFSGGTLYPSANYVMATKLVGMVRYVKWLLHMKLFNPFVTRSCQIT